MPAGLTNQQINDGLLGSAPIWPTTVTFSIPSAGAAWPGYSTGEPTHATYSVLNATQAAAFRTAVAAWDDLIALDLSERVDSSGPGQIRIAFVDVDAFGHGGSAGYAYTGSTQAAATGDIWIDTEAVSSTFALGTDDYALLLHELGHALGLKHPFEGNGLPAAFDTTRYTVMSYTAPADNLISTFTQQGTTLNWSGVPAVAASPMLLDVIALQNRYGAEASQNGGDSTYAYAQDFRDFFTLRDTGGFDTLNFTAHTRGSVISLVPETYSSVGYFPVADQVAYWTARFPGYGNFIASQLNRPDTFTWSNNLALAPGTIIETVLAGSGADTVVGNQAANTVMGGAGNDVVTDDLGDDYLRGEEGNDSISGGAGFDDLHGNMGNDTVRGQDGPDWSVGGKDQDLLFGDAGDDIVYGNIGDDTCEGGTGADLVRGGQGNDTLSGGEGDDYLAGDRDNDTISGGGGADIFHTHNQAGIDRIVDFSTAQGDRVNLLAGTTYTLLQVGSDTVIDMGGGNQAILVGVSMSSLTGGWIYGA